MTDREIAIPMRGRHESNIRLFYSTREAGRRPMENHSHPEIEIHIIENGGGKYYYNNSEHDIHPHDVFLFRSNEVHYCVDRTDDEGGRASRSFGLYFMPDFLQQLDDSILNTGLSKLFSNMNMSFVHQITPETYVGKQVYSLSRDILNEFETKKYGYESMITIELVNLLATYMRSYTPEAINKIKSTEKISNANISGIQTAMEYISDNLSEQLTLETLSEKANMSPSYFSYIFKKLNGFSVWDYIISCRVALSRQYLATTDMSIIEITNRCGYNNSANFNRQFKKIVGMTPTQYRNAE